MNKRSFLKNMFAATAVATVAPIQAQPEVNLQHDLDFLETMYKKYSDHSIPINEGDFNTIEHTMNNLPVAEFQRWSKRWFNHPVMFVKLAKSKIIDTKCGTLLKGEVYK